MLNKIWYAFIIISIIVSIFLGKTDELNTEIFNSLDSTVQMCIGLFGTICFWSGMMNIAKNTSFIDKIKKIINPLVTFLFPDVKSEETKNDISMNMVSNIMGLGNAATPLGISAMKKMEKENENYDMLSDSMIMFIVINTASIQIIPTTVIAIRSSLGSNNPTGIIIPVWFASICAFSTVIILTKILSRRKKW